MFQSIFNQSTLIAPKRKNRPMIHKTDTNYCPFCSENMDLLEEIVAEEWHDKQLIARIVTNKYPIVNSKIQGLHDVIIDTDSHTKHPKDFSLLHWEKLLIAIQHRWQQIMKNPHIQFIQVFKNYGLCAGASISHSHWQIIALEELPYSVYEKYKDFNKVPYCYFCNAMHHKEGYLIWENEFLEIWAPPIPQFIYEVWLIPKKHHQHYGELSKEELKSLGMFLKYLLESYEQLSPNYDFNICMMSGAIKGEVKYHFYIKLVMRIGHIAGFEIATGCNIVTTNPKDYAEQIKTFLKERIEQ